MAQHFDNIQVSDKGMVKLIRNNGKDYIFPASKLNSVGRYKKAGEEIREDIFGLIQLIMQSQEEPEYGTRLNVDGENMYIDVEYTEELYSRLNAAKMYSVKKYVNKYGTFS